MCVFCKIVNNEVPSYKIYEDDNFLAFLDISQATIGHTLVIPKTHFNSMGDIDPMVAGDLFNLTVRLANKISQTLDVEDYNIINNKGRIAGQTVDHFHVHIIPRYRTDDLVIKYSTIKLNSEEFIRIQNQLR